MHHPSKNDTSNTSTLYINIYEYAVYLYFVKFQKRGKSPVAYFAESLSFNRKLLLTSFYTVN